MDRDRMCVIDHGRDKKSPSFPKGKGGGNPPPNHIARYTKPCTSPVPKDHDLSTTPEIQMTYRVISGREADCHTCIGKALLSPALHTAPWTCQHVLHTLPSRPTSAQKWLRQPVTATPSRCVSCNTTTALQPNLDIT